MGDNSGISWTDATWNPVTGCSKVSPGCANCLDPNTPILMADMRWVPIGQIRVGDAVLGFGEPAAVGENRTYAPAIVEAVWDTRSPAVEISVGDRIIVGSEDHRFLSRARPYWRQAQAITLRTSLVDIGMPDLVPDTTSEGYLMGYLAGAVDGDGTMRIDGSGRHGTKQSYCRIAVLATDRAILDRIVAAFAYIAGPAPRVMPFDGGASHLAANPLPMMKVETRRMEQLVAIRDNVMPRRYDPQWMTGWLAGFFDTDGSHNKNLRFNQTKPNGHLDLALSFIEALGFHGKRETFRGRTGRSVRIEGDVEDRIRFLSTIQSALSRKTADVMGRRFPSKSVSQVTGVRRIGDRSLIDIQTSTGTFIAAGIATHNCYAETLATTRLVGKPGYTGLPWTPANAAVNVVLRPERLDQPLRWTRPRMVFVNSMSDLFHELVPDDFILSVFDVMNRATYNGGANMGRIRDEHREGHIFQVLTKRTKRMSEFVSRLRFDSVAGLSLDGPGFQFTNKDIWLGTSVENQRMADERIPQLVLTPAATRFLSVEPLLERVSIEAWLWLTGPSTAGPWADALGRARGGDGIGGQMMSCAPSQDIDWVIVGGESGPGRRPFDMRWAREIRDECRDARVAFFFKQAGASRSGRHPYLTDEDGRCWEWHQYPGDLALPVLTHQSYSCEYSPAPQVGMGL